LARVLAPDVDLVGDGGLAPSISVSERSIRRVVSYEVLLRIADGFGIRRGRMGLAFDEETEAMYAGLEHEPGAPRPLWEIVDGQRR
jgi:hypothetical protein